MKFYTTALLPARRALFVGALAIAGISLLQGCFPIMVAGVGATALAAADRRTTGTYVEDESLEWKVSNLIRQHFGSLNRVVVTSYNRNVLLVGQVQDENVRAEAQRLASTVSNVRAVVNELTIGPAISLSSRSNDTVITGNVKTRFLNNKVFSTNHVKVVTEAGVVFLLGIVTRTEGDQAAEIARTSKGVKKVVRVFEYIGEDEAQAIDTRNNENSDSPPEAP
ncbi:MAG: BON domain-containing protein [Betaproteobacteria bacterium]|nr:BON domain-containing protein [Betaproteobacteria bacterium]